MRKSFTVGQELVTIEAEGDASFLTLLRESLGRKSVVRGCAIEECGACRVTVNGQLRASCRLAFRDVPDGAVILAREDVDHEPLVEATVASFEAERPTRCRLCVGGLAVTAHHLVEEGKRVESAPQAAEIESALTHATCMCTGRGSLRRALQASLLRRG